MMRLLQITFFMCLPFSLLVAEVPDVVKNSIGDAIRVGETRVNVLFWDLYDISLYSSKGKFLEEKPFALRLQYLRDIPGKVIAEKSIEEMRRQGVNEVKLAAWFSQLEQIMPDVRFGSELIGVFESGKPTRFYDREEFIGQVMDPDFGKPFSEIWLGTNSSLPKIRINLIGESDE